MKIDQVEEKWSKKYKKSIDCSNPKGFSQKAHCAGKKKKKKNESLIREWWEEWQQATKKFPQIGQYMRAYGYDAYSKDGVRSFVKHNPEWINAMGKAYGRYANIGNTLANVYGASQGMTKGEVGDALRIRDQVKQKYPDAFKKLKSGDAMGALKAAGVTEEIARWFVDRHMFLVNEMVREGDVVNLNKARVLKGAKDKFVAQELINDLKARGVTFSDPGPERDLEKELIDIITGKKFESKVDELKIEKPDSKDTKGIKRAEMPQVATKDYPEFIEYLKDNGNKNKKVTMPAKALKATQGEFSDAGVERQLAKMQAGTPKKPVIASDDNYIIDGHHRWLVAWNTASSVEVFKVNMDADELLKLVKAFPKTTYKDIYTEELYDFDKDQPMKSTVAVPGYGTMSIEGLMKNLIQSAMELVDRMKQGTDGMRFADYQLNNNKVFLTKLSALIDALDGLQAIRKQGGARSRNIQKEMQVQIPYSATAGRTLGGNGLADVTKRSQRAQAEYDALANPKKRQTKFKTVNLPNPATLGIGENEEEQKQELPIDTSSIFNYIQRLESGQNIEPQDADLMRRGVQSLTADRQTINPQAILQLLTILTG